MSNSLISSPISSIHWPVTLSGLLESAHGVSLYQYEFTCHDTTQIASLLPVVSGNPYSVTVSRVKGKKGHGIPVTCVYSNWSVIGQFHRYANNKGVWLYTDFSNRHQKATQEWNTFLLHFGITVGKLYRPIPVYMDFYQNNKIVIRLKRLPLLT